MTMIVMYICIFNYRYQSIESTNVPGKDAKRFFSNAKMHSFHHKYAMNLNIFCFDW